MPDNQKKLFSFITAIILTLVIVGFWFSFSSVSSDENLPEEQSKLSSISPWQMIKDEFSKAFSGTKELMDTSSDQISSSTVPVEVIQATSTASTTDNL